MFELAFAGGAHLGGRATPWAISQWSGLIASAFAGDQVSAGGFARVAIECSGSPERRAVPSPHLGAKQGKSLLMIGFRHGLVEHRSGKGEVPAALRMWVRIPPQPVLNRFADIRERRVMVGFNAGRWWPVTFRL